MPPSPLDEWQAGSAGPGCARPGPFQLTGSAYGDLEGTTAAGTGRITRFRWLGMTETGHRPPISAIWAALPPKSRACSLLDRRDRQPDRLREPPGREVAQPGKAIPQVDDLILGRTKRPEEGVERAVLRDHLIRGGGRFDRFAKFAAILDDLPVQPGGED